MITQFLAISGGSDLTGRIGRLVESVGMESLLGLGALAALAAVASTQFDRKWLIWAYVVCLMFSGHQIELLDSTSTLIRWGLIGCLVISTSKGQGSTGIICKMLAVHWAFSIISTFWSPNPIGGIQLAALSFMLFAPAASALSDEFSKSAEGRILPRILNTCSLIYIANALIGFSGLTGSRFSGLITSAPLFVITGGLLMPSLLWGFFQSEAKPKKRLHAAKFVLIFTICFLSGQRAGLFAGILGCIPLIVGRRGSKVNYAIGALIVTALAAYFALQAFPEQADFVSRRYRTTDVTGREYKWRQGIELVADNLFLGYGAGSHSIRRFGFHNAFLQEWHNGGISGLFLFSGAFVVMLVKSTRLAFDRKRSEADRELAKLLLGWTIAMISGAMFESKLASPSNILAFLAVNVGVMIHLLERRSVTVGGTRDDKQRLRDKSRSFHKLPVRD